MSHRQADDLTTSLRAVNRARSVLDVARTQGSPSVRTAPEQRALLAALEDYAQVLTRHGHPLPYRMRSDLVMYRTMFRAIRHSAH